MCGICGLLFFDSDRTVEKETIERMKSQLVHRGPDDHGSFVSKNVGLGFRRLSIVDLALGNQPMYNEDKSVVVVFNGEIYNHLQIRNELANKGHKYRTNCDTETIVHLYEEEGTACFSRLNGMFAIAIWDARCKSLVLARDRLGIKPLYYFRRNGALGFASEIKALFESDLIEADIGHQAVGEYLTFRYVAGEDTFFRDVRNVPPGHYFICVNGEVRDEAYWELPEISEPVEIRLEDAVDELQNLLDESVQLRLMSDVPLGTFCSGGVDSSLVTALASRHTGSNLNTFSVGFAEADYDESHYAKAVSDRYNTCHHALEVNSADFAELLPRMIWYNDEPLNHPNSVQIYQISKLARETVTVVLTGEGADELFGGYPRYLMMRILGRTDWVPRAVRGTVGRLLGLLPHRKMRKLAKNLPLGIREAAALNSSFVDWSMTNFLLAQDFDLNTVLEKRLGQVVGSDLTPNRALDYLYRMELRTYLVSILNRQDKMSMAASIESRVPFLDHRLVEWALSLNQKLKHGRLENKLMVKKLGERWLPNDVIYRQKSGFGVPLSAWIKDRSHLGRYLENLMSEDLSIGDSLNMARIRDLVKHHMDGREDNSEFLWTLINLELWNQIFVENRGVDSFSLT